MANFITDDTDLPAEKVDNAAGVRGRWTAAMWNTLRQAVLDVRTQFRNSSLPNFLPNTQWQIATGLSGGAQMRENGTAVESSMTVTGHTTGVNEVTFTTSANGNLRVDDLVLISGGSAPATFKVNYLRVTEIPSSTTFKAKLQLGVKSDAFTSNYSATIVGVGNGASQATGAGFDGWSKTSGGSGLIIWRDSWTSNTKTGSKYSCGVAKGASDTQAMWHQVPARDLAKYKGRTITFGVWVKHLIKGAAGTWRLFVNDGVTQTYSTSATSQSFAWKELSASVSSSATILYVGIEFLGASGDVYYVSQPMGVLGTFIGEGNYNQPKNEVLIPLVHAQFISLNNASPALPSALSAATGKGNDTDLVGSDNSAFKTFMIDPYAETNGAIAPTVKSVTCKLEGRCESEGDAWGIGNNNVAGGAFVFGMLMYSVRGGFMMQPQKCSIPLDDNGRCYVFSGLIPLTGTMTFTNGSATVTGVGTRFSTELSNGQLIKQNTGSGNKFYRIKDRASDTSLTLGVPAGADATFDESTAAGATALKNNANWYNFAMEANEFLLS